MKIIFWNRVIGLVIIILYSSLIALIATSVYTTYFTINVQFLPLTVKTALTPTLFGVIGVLLGGLVFKKKLKVDLGIALSVLNFSLLVFIIYIT